MKVQRSSGSGRSGVWRGDRGLKIDTQLRYADKPYINALKPSLRNLGFKNYNNTWRREYQDTLVLCKVDYETISHDVDIVFAVWIKALGPRKLTELKYELTSAHVLCDLSCVLDDRNFYDMIAASRVEEDDFEWHVAHYSSTRPENEKLIIESFKLNAPQTSREKVERFAGIFDRFGPKLIDSLSTESGLRTLLEKPDTYLTVSTEAATYLEINIKIPSTNTYFE